jgi:hypothetical protein
MALASKNKSQVDSLLRRLFRENGIPTTRPEFTELVEDSKPLERMVNSGNLVKLLETKVVDLAKQIETEKQAESEKQKAQAKSLAIASERTLSPVRLNNSRMLMALPWFSPDQRLRTDYFEYTSADGRVTLGVHPSPKYGAAKVWDGDVLMYALSKAVKAFLATKEWPNTVSFTAYEYLKQAGKEVQTRNRQILRESLTRLSHTSYECSAIQQGTGKRGEDHFSLCSARWLTDTDGTPDKIEIAFSEALFKHFASKNDLLSLKDNLLLEAWKEDRSGIRKRLIMVVGVHLGEKNSWRVGLTTLQGMCGHIGELKYFKRELQKLAPSLPWSVKIEVNAEREQVVEFEGA